MDSFLRRNLPRSDSTRSVESATMSLTTSVDLNPPGIDQDEDIVALPPPAFSEPEINAKIGSAETSSSMPEITSPTDNAPLSTFLPDSTASVAYSGSSLATGSSDEAPLSRLAFSSNSLQVKSTMAGDASVRSLVSKYDEEDDDKPLSILSRNADGASIISRTSRPRGISNSNQNQPVVNRPQSGSVSASFTQSQYSESNAAQSPLVPLTPLDQNGQSIAATVAHLILLKLEPWMAETGRTLVGLENSVKSIEDRLIETGHEVGKPGTLLGIHHSVPSRAVDFREGHPLLNVQKNMQEELNRVAGSLAHLAAQHQTQQKQVQNQILQGNSGGDVARGGVHLLNLPGLGGEGVVPGSGFKRVESVPKRATCIRCEGIGFVHDPKSKKKHVGDLKVSCKKCLTCGLCSGAGILMNVVPCDNCDANGFIHHDSPTCRLGVSCEEGCVTCTKCAGAGVLEDPIIAEPPQTSGWIPKSGLIAAHPTLKSPVGERPTTRSRSGSTAGTLPTSAALGATEDGALVAALTAIEKESKRESVAVSDESASRNPFSAIKKALSRSTSRKNFNSIDLQSSAGTSAGNAIASTADSSESGLPAQPVSIASTDTASAQENASSTVPASFLGVVPHAPSEKPARTRSRRSTFNSKGQYEGENGPLSNLSASLTNDEVSDGNKTRSRRATLDAKDRVTADEILGQAERPSNFKPPLSQTLSQRSFVYETGDNADNAVVKALKSTAGQTLSRSGSDKNFSSSETCASIKEIEL